AGWEREIGRRHVSQHPGHSPHDRAGYQQAVGGRQLAEMSTAAELLTNREYKYGFVTDIESDVIPRGLSEDTVRLISSKKHEPEWMLEFRLKAYRNWLKMAEPSRWPNFDYPEIDFQNISYYAAP